MKRWWADTLFKRLFVLMWLALVVSHLLAFLAVRNFTSPPAGGAPRDMPLPPVMPSLPPGALFTDTLPTAPPAPMGEQPDRPLPAARPGDGPAAGKVPPLTVAEAGPPGGAPRGLPRDALWLDYGVRLLVIGLAAWLGARWLSAPMHRLASASQALGQSLGSASPGTPGEPPPPIDERRGTLEVRQTARVFNAMSQRLREQFRAQGLLMASISHDLRTPLARLRLRLEKQVDPGAVAPCIADVREMDALIGSVLDLVREQQTSPAPQRIDLLSLLQSLADDLGEQGHEIALTGERVLALARSTALKRVFLNLLGNALTHGGSAEVSLSTLPDGAQVIVDDHGPGIPEGQMETVFAPFYRLHSPGRELGPGSGLGLHIARDLLERQGGTLRLMNRPAGGLRAVVTLPLG